MQENKNERTTKFDDAPYNERVNAGQAGGIISEYIVEESDTLQDICDRYGVSIEDIMAANAETLKEPSDLMKPGSRIMIPNRLR